jgi:hypothetical protein
MVDEAAIEHLKRRLRKEVQVFCNRRDVAWKQPIVQTIHEFQEADSPAVLFGGTLRSLLWSRLKLARTGRPRDIDIVVQGTDIESLRHRFERSIERETRFGGLKLRRDKWEFDVWPVQKTWMFLNDPSLEPSFEHLPYTTAFNLEAIAVEMWPQKGHARSIFAGDDQFFRGLIEEELEINREENPFPELTVIRALLMAPRLDFSLGPRLAIYIAEHASGISNEAWELVQRQHYGQIVESASVMRQLASLVVRAVEQGEHKFRLPRVRQLSMFEDSMRWPKPSASESKLRHPQDNRSLVTA